MDPSTLELFSFDVVHVPRQKLHSLEDWSAPAYRREVLAQLRSETGKTLSRVNSEGGASTGLHDLEGFEDCASDDGVGCEGEGSGDEEAAASSLRAAKISERELFGGSNGSDGSDNSDDEASDGVPGYVPAIMAHKYARLNQKKRPTFPKRKKQQQQQQQPVPKPRRGAPAVKRSQSAMSKGSASTSSGHSDKTAAISSKRMRTVLGYDETAPTLPDAASSETAGGARRSKRPASLMDARAVVVMDEDVERQAIGSVSGVSFKLGRAPKVTYRSAADA
jgi:hypothetical protein